MNRLTPCPAVPLDNNEDLLCALVEKIQVMTAAELDEFTELAAPVLNSGEGAAL